MVGVARSPLVNGLAACTSNERHLVLLWTSPPPSSLPCAVLYQLQMSAPEAGPASAFPGCSHGWSRAGSEAASGLGH